MQRPTLVLPFAQGILDPRITWSRASAATYLRADGALATAATGEPRFTHCPNTLTPLGLFCEEQVTNLQTYSNTFSNAAWTKTNCSITAAATGGPDGTVSASDLVESTATGNHVITGAAATVTATNTHSFSVWAKASERTRLRLRIQNPSSTGNYVQADFNLSAGTASNAANGGSGSGAVAAIEAWQDGWYRCTVSGIPHTSATQYQGLIYLLDASGNVSYTGTTNYSLFIFGAQLEDHYRATSYIATTSGSVTRSADSATMSTADIPAYNANESTFFLAWQWAMGQNNAMFLFSFDAGSTSDYWRVSQSAAGDFLFRMDRSSATQVSLALGTDIAGGQIHRVAVAFKNNDYAASFNGAACVTSGSGGLPTAATTLRLGQAVGSAKADAGLLLAAYWPRRLGNSELETLTATV